VPGRVQRLAVRFHEFDVRKGNRIGCRGHDVFRPKLLT
jgi:hypothetical protein